MEEKKQVPLFHRIEDRVSFIVLALLALIPTLEVIIRKVFRTGIPASNDYIIHLVLWVTFLGGMATSRSNRHLALSAGVDSIKHPSADWLRVFNGFISTTFTSAFAWSSLSFVILAFDGSMKAGFIPLRILGAIMPVGYAVMSGRFLKNAPQAPLKKWIIGAGFLFGTFLSLGSITNIIYFFFWSPPMFVDTLQMFFYSAVTTIAIPVIILILVSTFTGAPLFVVLGGVAYMLFARIGEPLEIIANESYTMLIGKSLPAIPLFTLTGFFLSESKAGERLVRLFQAFFGWLPGGLAIMAVLVSTFFTAFTGASGVTILALGALLFFVMDKSGRYKENFSRGLITSSGSIGILFPPSLPIILYGVTAQINVVHMFLGGIMPGVLFIVAIGVMGVIVSLRSKQPRIKFERKEAWTSLKDSFWEILLPIIVLASYFGGLTTLVETGAIAVVYAFLVEVVIKRDLKLKDLYRLFEKCIPIVGGVLVILAAAQGVRYYLIDAEVPVRLTAWVELNIHSKYVFLILLNLALLVTGMLMDIFSAILVVVPLIIPLGNLFGIHPVHLGAIFFANLCLGYLTPPVGMDLFLASYRFDKPLTQIARNAMPFFAVMFVVVLLVTYVPWFSTVFVP